MLDIKYAGLNFTDEELKAIEDCEFEIVDITKFLAYLKINKQATKLQFIKVTNKDIRIDLLKPRSQVILEIMDFDEAEQKKILKRQKAFRVLHTTAINTRRAAFGGYEKNKTTLKTNILSDKKSDILEYFGRMYTIKEVLVILKNDLNFNHITSTILTDFYRENLDEIKRLQEKHKTDYSHLRLTAKTSRLEELTYLYSKLKRKYENTGNREDHKALLATMESIRKEVEGDKLTVSGNIEVKVQQEINLHVRAEIMKGVALKEVILSRLSARSGINPIKILSSLNDSYYAKWNRLINDTIDVDHEEISFPSAQNYDFDKIIKINEVREKQEVIDLKQEEQVKIQQEALSEKDKIKNFLLEKLKASSNSLSNQQINIDRRLI